MRRERQRERIATRFATIWSGACFWHFHTVLLLSVLSADTDAFAVQKSPLRISCDPELRRRSFRWSQSLQATLPDRSSHQDSSHVTTSHGLTNETLTTEVLPQIASSSSASVVNLTEVDVLYGSRTPLLYDERLERYVPALVDPHSGIFLNGGSSIMSRRPSFRRRLTQKVQSLLQRSFLPEGVTPSYYRFIKWRILQRFVNANVHVFGTQSLLMGLGIKSKLGLTAALNWVLKDALGKIVRMAWASKMGRKFDSDAKRWRFRSSLVFALGNGLEIITYIFPALFLLWATLANCCKQVSMLTSSSTRNSIYNSFRDGTRENIGDITAKGEAQIAIVDLLGIASGVTISRAVGMSVKSVLGVYVALQIVEIACMYQEIRAVEFRVLNFERLIQLVSAFASAPPEQYSDYALPTPQEMAHGEKIFLPPQHLARRAIAFGSLGRAKLSPDELRQLLDMFQNERFILVVGENVKNRRRRVWNRIFRRAPSPEEHCHIVLHTDATNVDITKSTLALCFLRQAIKERQTAHDGPIRTRDCVDTILHAYRKADRNFPTFLRTMTRYGWASPARFMFGRVSMRAGWELKPRRNGGASSSDEGN